MGPNTAFSRRVLKLIAASVCTLAHFVPTAHRLRADDRPEIRLIEQSDRVRVQIGGVDVTEYVFSDDQTLRPYFRQLRTRSNVQVTRTHPPVAGVDLDDHPTMHPGLWLAFGDVGGADFWRNKGVVKHQKFVKPPLGGIGHASFTAVNVYEAQGQSLLDEECAVTIQTAPSGYLLDWTSTFTVANGDVAFGDQEEMGLGVRMATPLAVKNGGQIVSSEGRQNEAEVWGRQADWCAYSGVMDGKPVGIALMPHPANFRRSWFHARDYGLLVANPFGRKAFTRGESSRVAVTPAAPLTLRFGIFVYDATPESPANVAAVHKTYAAQ